MPTYEIHNEKTGEVKEVFCSYKDKEKELKKHGKDWVYLIGAPSFHYDGKEVIQRTSSGWKDHLQRIKDASGKYGRNKNTIQTGRSQH